ncbi:poly(A) polymerase alpha-like [Genypterus blacodes]|uniref:poly(A) polymerase alpha-like n=1 Tax=Genypterus blacodes TaxID=154954 RepID=UPI003F764D08
MPNLTVNQHPGRPWASKHTPLSAPISLVPPSEADLHLNGQMLRALRTFDIFEDESELQHRATVVRKLDALFKEWMKEISQEKNLPPYFIETVGGKVDTFGSYRLGVHSKDGDIDALCIAPEHVEREDFFTSFFDKLKQQEEAKNVHAARDAFVPIINLVFDGVEIDLLFARIPLKRIPSNLKLLNDNLIKNMDPCCVRSLNGCKVAETILDLVPNVDTFRLALMAIKLWAKRREIYSSALGFLGGVSWAILLARVCQLYPNAAAATLVCKFFRFYILWEWPLPIYLVDLVDLQFGFSVWDPRVNYGDESHLMPVITPCYPQQNSSFNVTASTRAIIVEEIKRGFQVTEEIQQGRADWSKLFEAPNFFQKYKHYIVLLASAPSEKQGSNWFHLVGSQIRHFVGSLEQHGSFAAAHINLHSFRGPEEAFDKEKTSTMWLIGVEFKKANGSEILNVDITEEVRSFCTPRPAEMVYGRLV